MTSPEALAQLHARAFAGQARAWSAQEFQSLLSSPHVNLTGHARAFALVRAIVDEAEILTIVTDPDHRRQGHAATCLQEAEQVARQAGAARLFLEVAADNEPAIRLYHGAGFSETGRRRAYYSRPDGGPVDAILMEKPLM